jgi:hypothetical protein
MSLVFVDAGGWTSGPGLAKQDGFDGVRTEVSADATHEQVVRNALQAGLRVCFLWNSSDVARGVGRYKALGCTRENAPYFELLNEPGLNGVSGAAYANVLRSGRSQLDQAFAAAERPLLLASADGGHADASGNDYLSQVLNGLGAQAGIVDGWTVHPYGGSQKQYGGFALNRKRMLDVRARTGRPVIATECGLTTGTSGTPDSAAATEDEQMGSTSGPAPGGQPGSGSGLLGIVKFAHDEGFDISVFALIDQQQSGPRMYGTRHHDGSHAAKRVVGPLRDLMGELRGVPAPTPDPTPDPTPTPQPPASGTAGGDVRYVTAAQANDLTQHTSMRRTADGSDGRKAITWTGKTADGRQLEVRIRMSADEWTSIQHVLDGPVS